LSRTSRFLRSLAAKAPKRKVISSPQRSQRPAIATPETRHAFNAKTQRRKDGCNTETRSAHRIGVPNTEAVTPNLLILLLVFGLAMFSKDSAQMPVIRSWTEGRAGVPCRYGQASRRQSLAHTRSRDPVAQKRASAMTVRRTKSTPNRPVGSHFGLLLIF
jgi:hypothetical protein